MLDHSMGRVELHSHVGDYADRLRWRRNLVLFALITVLISTFGIYVVLRFFMPGSMHLAPMLTGTALIIIAIPCVIWVQPRFGMYLLCLCACLFSQNPASHSKDPTMDIPVFWNIASVGQYMGGTNALSAIHFNFAEFIMVWTALFWSMRKISLREMKLVKGEFFNPFIAFMACTVFGVLHGLTTGGDITLVLWEVRAIFYLFFAYLLSVNIVEDRKHALTLIWTILIGIGIKSIIGSVIYLGDTNVSADQGVLEHEDSLLMNIILMGAIGFWLAGQEKKLKWAFVLFSPFAMLTSLGNGRRAGIACLIIALPVALLLAYRVFAERRKSLGVLIAILTVASAIYFPVAWNSSGAWALPARAIKSRTAPDDRDASSDQYRMSENYNLKLTRDMNPWLGFGYGKAFIEAMYLPGRNDPFKLILPHNGQLWMWMRLGNIGYVCWWFFVMSALMRGAYLLKQNRDMGLNAVGILAICMLLMLLIYGEYDLCFANQRTMWLTGSLLGLLAVLPKLQKSRDEIDNSVQAETDEETKRLAAPSPNISF